MIQDVRSIANEIIDVAGQHGCRLTNMVLNKIVYFIYEDCLLLRNAKITNAKIEAWDHGPVFRELYSSFKKFQDRPVTEKATRTDPESGKAVVCDLQGDAEIVEFIRESAKQFVGMSAARLRNLSHLPGSPWDRVWNHQGSTNVGMHISDVIIIDCAKNGWRQ